MKTFKYLGFIWTNKVSLKKKIQSPLTKLRWLRSGNTISKEVLGKCFLTYTFPHFAWLFPFFPALRIVHRAQYLRTNDIHAFTKENPLKFYIQRYINSRPIGPSSAQSIIKSMNKKKENEIVNHHFGPQELHYRMKHPQSTLITCPMGMKTQHEPSICSGEYEVLNHKEDLLCLA